MLDRRFVLTLSAAFLALSAAGCTIQPLYADMTDQTAPTFYFDEPDSRLAQVMIDELRTRFRTPTGGEAAPRIHITAAQGNRDLTMTRVSPGLKFDQMEAIVNATMIVYNSDGRVALSVKRGASQYYTSTHQIFAVREAEISAGEAAAKAAAETLRLTLLANLSNFR